MAEPDDLDDLAAADRLERRLHRAVVHGDQLAGRAPSLPPEGVGLGRQAGPLRPDYGPAWAHLACSECGATWVGPVGEWCDWCEQRIARQLVDQAALDAARARRPAHVAGWNRCPVHHRVWKGLPLEVCGAHGGPWSCNERAVPISRTDAERLAAA